MRANLAIGALVPFTYIWAQNGWMLLPAFSAQGIISAGIDLGLLNTALQLAEPDKVVEYAAVQATIVGIRGIIGPFIGVGLVHLGVPAAYVFALGTLLTVLAFWVSLQIQRGPDAGADAGQTAAIALPMAAAFQMAAAIAAITLP